MQIEVNLKIPVTLNEKLWIKWFGLGEHNDDSPPLLPLMVL